MNTHPQIWDLRLMMLAHEISEWSKDPSTKVGAVIVDSDRRPVSFGYNGFSRGITDDTHLLQSREKKYEMVLHAEQNALLFANRQTLEGCTLYCTLQPCSRCTAMLIQKKIGRIVSLHAKHNEHERLSRACHWDLADAMICSTNTAFQAITRHEYIEFLIMQSGKLNAITP